MAVLKYKDPVTGEVKKVGAPFVEPRFISTTLYAANWTGNNAPFTYTLTGHDGESIEVVEDVSMTMEQLEVIEKAKIKSDPRSVENILYAFGTKPTIDVPVLLVVR